MLKFTLVMMYALMIAFFLAKCEYTLSMKAMRALRIAAYTLSFFLGLLIFG